MPVLYKYIYPEYVEEPHFHFTCGFGSVYKLTNNNGPHNYGVGYAIGVSGLKNYLIKLKTGNYATAEEQKIYTENDFGMPFLALLKEGVACSKTVNTSDESDLSSSAKYNTLVLNRLIKNLTKLEQAWLDDNEKLELHYAYQVINIISNSPTKNLTLTNALESSKNSDYTFEQ